MHAVTGNTNTVAGNVPPKANLGDLGGLASGLDFSTTGMVRASQPVQLKFFCPGSLEILVQNSMGTLHSPNPNREILAVIPVTRFMADSHGIPLLAALRPSHETLASVLATTLSSAHSVRYVTGSKSFSVGCKCAALAAVSLKPGYLTISPGS